MILPADAVLAGGGETGALIRAHDWAATPLGPPENWPQPLKTLVGVMLTANQPMFVVWGPGRTLLYNDAYAEILAGKHPDAMGRDFLDVWHEIRADLLPIVEEAYAGRPVHMDDIELVMHRRGYAEETHFAFSYTPVRNEAGEVAGFLCPCRELTERVLAERRQAFRLGLEERLRDLADPAEVTATASEALGRHLGVGQVIYAEADHDGEAVIIAREWNDGTMASNVGRHQLDDYGPDYIAELKRGTAVSIGDVHLDPRTSSPRALAAFARASIAGFLNVPLVKAGRLVAVLGVHSATPRAWSAEEVALAEETAERTWDAVERARAEAALREGEARYRALFTAAERKAAELRAVLESMPDGVYIGSVEGITLANQPALEQLGFSTREELNWHVATLADEIQTRDAETGEFIAIQDQAFARAVGGERVVQDVRVKHRLSGEERVVRCAAAPVLIDGQVIAAVAVNTDVTDQRRTEAALRAREAELRGLNDTLEAQVEERTAERDRAWRLSQDLLVVAERDGTLVEVNTAWTELLGWEPGELVGTSFVKFTHPDDLEATLAAFAGIVEAPLTVPYEYRFRHKDGGWRRFAWTAAFEDGRVYANGRDVTAEREREAELQAAQEALRQSHKMEAMGQLTGGVAHDFNNLLTPIMGALDRLLTRGVGSEREQRLMAGALESAERAKVLVQRLLAFARRQPLQPVAVDVGALVKGMAGLLGSTLGPKINVRVDLAEELPPAKGDLNQLEMALLNLAVNARDAMPEGGTLTISASRESVRGKSRLGLKLGHYVRLSVTDTGIGMDEATCERAVEPFFSTKGVGRGTGLGLSMVHGLAAQLGGGLSIQSKPGRGTTVELWLPLGAGPVIRAEANQTALQPITSHSRALLVDDEDLVRLSTADMLADLGFDVLEAGSAEEALRLLHEGTAVDLLVTDHLMPGLSGAELARKVRVLRPGLPILIVSGYADVEGLAPDLPRLVKPFRVAELAERVRTMVPSAAIGS